MREKTEYRSSLRSKRLIRAAFLELLGEKPLEKITVTELAERADLNRRTFYAHYADARAVMEEIEDEAAEHILGFISEIKGISFWADPLPLMQEVTTYLEKDREMYTIMLSASGAAMFVDKLQRRFADYMLNLSAFPPEVRRQHDYLNRAYFYAGGIAQMYQAWFRGEIGGTLGDIADTLTKLIVNDPLIMIYAEAL